jgi:hypothetical protein
MTFRVAVSLAAGVGLALSTAVMAAASPTVPRQSATPGQVPIGGNPPPVIQGPATPTTVLPPAFPVSPKAPTVYSCPTSVTAVAGPMGKPATLQRVGARVNDSGSGAQAIICTYKVSGELVAGGYTRGATCPAAGPGVVLSSSVAGTTTDTSRGCNIGAAFCHGPANSLKLSGPKSSTAANDGTCAYTNGTVDISFTPNGVTCISGSGAGSAGGNSPTGRFLCW